MMSITEANTRNLPTTAAPRGPKRYAKRTQAQAAAVLDLGPNAREGFEFVTTKCDGGWMYRQTDVVPPDTEAQIKAQGGKRGSRLPVPPRREQEAPATVPAAAAGASDAKGGADLPPAADPAQAPARRKPQGSLSALAAQIGWSTSAAPQVAITRSQQLMVEDGAPVGLMRGPDTVEAKARRARITQDAIARKIKNPPDAKKAKAKGAAKSTGANTKAALIGTLLMNPKGCTTADMLKATGWPSLSVPRQAKMVGLGLRKEKDGKVTRYFGVPLK